MKLFALATAATVMLATTASAMAPSQIEVQTQATLNKYGFSSVQASDLTRNQWAEIKSAVSDSDNDRTDVIALIEAALKR